MGGRPAGALFASAVVWDVVRSVRDLGASPDAALLRAHDAATRLSPALGLERGGGAAAACFTLRIAAPDTPGAAAVPGAVLDIAFAGDIGLVGVRRGAGELLRQSSAHRSASGRIASYLGACDALPRVEHMKLNLDGSWSALVLATDGLLDYAPAHEVGRVAARALAAPGAGPRDAAQAVTALAGAHGSSDDATVIVLTGWAARPSANGPSRPRVR